MDTKPLLYGIIGFLLGGLLVSIAATTFDKPGADSHEKADSHASMTMDQMTDTLRDKQGDAYDKAFIAAMIEHHEGAIDMATLSTMKAGHDKIKTLSREVITAQKHEIEEMKQWQHDWGYVTGDHPHTGTDKH
jgi:uncharacterized protein (DUF305 family)